MLTQIYYTYSPKCDYSSASQKSKMESLFCPFFLAVIAVLRAKRERRRTQTPFALNHNPNRPKCGLHFRFLKLLGLSTICWVQAYARVGKTVCLTIIKPITSDGKTTALLPRPRFCSGIELVYEKSYLCTQTSPLRLGSGLHIPYFFIIRSFSASLGAEKFIRNYL